MTRSLHQRCLDLNVTQPLHNKFKSQHDALFHDRYAKCAFGQKQSPINIFATLWRNRTGNRPAEYVDGAENIRLGDIMVRVGVNDNASWCQCNMC